MARCGCSGTVCSCTVVGAGNATVTGVGTQTNPYVVTASAAVIQVADTGSLDLTITGDGSPGNPYIISGTASGSGLDPEAMMDFLGRSTNAAKGLFGTGLINVTYDDPNDKITIATTATANSSDAFLLARANHTGKVTLSSMASDVSTTAPTTGQTLIWSGSAWVPTAIPSDATKADKSGSIRQFADVTDTATPGGYDVPGLIWDYGTSQLVWVDLAVIFASLDATGRLTATQRTKYDPDLGVFIAGDPIPSDFGQAGTGGIVFQEAAAASVVPIAQGMNGGANVTAATGVSIVTAADIAVGDWIEIAVGTSGEITLPSTYTITLGAGAVSGGFASQGTPAQQSGSAQTDIILGKCTTLIPAGTTITTKANQNRVELIVGIASCPNLVGSSVLDKYQTDAGGSSTTLALATGSSGVLSQPHELCLCAFTINCGNPVIRSLGVTSGSNWIPLQAEFDAIAAGSARGMRMFYKEVNATTAVQGQCTVTSSDSNSGAHTGVLVTLKAA